MHIMAISPLIYPPQPPPQVSGHFISRSVVLLLLLLLWQMPDLTHSYRVPVIGGKSGVGGYGLEICHHQMPISPGIKAGVGHLH